MYTYNQEDLTLYLKEVRKTTLLTREDELEIAKRIQNGDKEAEEKLILANLRFVISIARQYQNVGIPLADLISEGNYGLIKAAKKFKAETGNKFISYAVWWIRQSILQCINENSRMIRIPVNISNELIKLRKKNIQDSSISNMYPSVVFMDNLMSESDQIDYMMEFSITENPEDILINKELSLSDALEKAMSTLSARERYIINEYYLNSDGTKTLEAIGAELNLTKERVRQIKDKALRKIRNNAELLFHFMQ